jgi:hypothetical protein
MIAHKDSLKDLHLIEAYIDFLIHAGYKGINEKGERIRIKKIRNRPNREGRRINYWIDDMIDTFYDTFKPPFCA